MTLGAERDAGGNVVLIFRDTGIGIAEADIEKALSPFGQIPSSHSPKNTGTGLGLPLAKRMVELHGGMLALESAVSRGTTVRVTWPASRIVTGDTQPAVA